jgi:hypothetical protein
MEDGYAAELVQQAIGRSGGESSFIELGGEATGAEENLQTESAIRAFWSYYRSVMEL